MSEHPKTTEKSVLEKVEIDRRSFVRNLTLGTTFAAPFIASYSMDGLRVSMAQAGILESSNQGGGFFEFLRSLIARILEVFQKEPPM
jgi:hypothetical protein